MLPPLVLHTTGTHGFDNVRLRNDKYHNRYHHHNNRRGSARTCTLDTAGHNLLYCVVEGLELLGVNVDRGAGVPKILETPWVKGTAPYGIEIEMLETGVFEPERIKALGHE